MFALAEIFFRPSRVFAGLRSRARWPLPFLATVAVYMASTLLLIQMAGMELITLQRYQRNTRLAERVGSDTVDKMVDSSNTRIPKLIILSRNTAVTAVFLLVVAGVLTIAAAAMRAEPKPGYGRMLALTGFAVFPFAVLQLVGTAVFLQVSSDVSAVDLDHVVSLSLARLVDPADVGPAMLALAQWFDLIVFAQVAFLAYGFSQVAALPFLRCLAVCTALWAVVMIWSAAIAVVL